MGVPYFAAAAEYPAAVAEYFAAMTPRPLP